VTEEYHEAAAAQISQPVLMAEKSDVHTMVSVTNTMSVKELPENATPFTHNLSYWFSVSKAVGETYTPSADAIEISQYSLFEYSPG
jgi:hypothetical protein